MGFSCSIVGAHFYNSLLRTSSAIYGSNKYCQDLSELFCRKKKKSLYLGKKHLVLIYRTLPVVGSLKAQKLFLGKTIA